MGQRLLFLVLATLLIFPLVYAEGSNTTLGFAGSIVDVTTGNYTKGASITNITLNISEAASCTSSVIYSEKFVNNVSGGVFSLLAGYYEEPLNLEYGRDYFSCYEITNGTFTEVFGPDPFTAGKGIIGGEDMNTTDNYTFGDVTINGWTNSTYFNGTYYGDGTNLIISTTYNATNITTISGTLDDGNLTSIQTPEDGDSYNVSEAAGANPLIVVINFTDITDFDNVIGRIWYEGGQGHEIQIEIWRTDTSVWENYEEYTDMTNFVNIHFPVFDATDHITADGRVFIRFNHAQVGNPSHNFRIDYLAIVDGFSTLTTFEHDGLSSRDDKENHPWAFPTDASREISGDVNITTLTTGSMLFAGLQGRISQDNTVFFWNDTLDRLRIGGTTFSPAEKNLHVLTSGADQHIRVQRFGSQPRMDLVCGGSWCGINVENITGVVPDLFSIWQNFSDAGGTNMFHILKNGRIGFGTARPVANLDISDSTPGTKNYLNLKNTGGFASGAPAITWENSAGTINTSQIRSQPGAGFANSLFIISVANAARVLVDRIFINNLGYLGVGIPDPQNAVNVLGEVNATGDMYENSDDRVCTAENNLCSVKEFFIPVVYGTGAEGATGDFHRWTCAVQTGQAAHMNFYVPNDFNSVIQAVVTVISPTAQFTATINVDFAANNEPYNTHSATTGPVPHMGLAATQILEVDFSGLLVNSAVGDYVGVQIVDAGAVLAGDGDFHVIGVRFLYV